MKKFFFFTLLQCLSFALQAQNTFYGLNAGLGNTSGAYNSGLGADALRFNTTGAFNSGLGFSALRANTIGRANTASGAYALGANTTGNTNAAFGFSALLSNTTGNSNHAFGNSALYFNTTGSNNCAFGPSALYANTTGHENIGIGLNALYTNTSGYWNTGVGTHALYQNTTGYGNSALGRDALRNNKDGRFNAAFGDWAMQANTSGIKNTGLGNSALLKNTTGSHNVAVGTWALQENIGGEGNTATGGGALQLNKSGKYNTGAGYNAGYFNAKHTYCTYLGYNANPATLDSFNNSTAIGNNSRITASHQVRVGAITVTSIGGYVGWTVLSDGRYKKNVREDVKGLDFILQLRPVTYTIDVQKLNGALNVTGSTPGVEDGKDAPTGATTENRSGSVEMPSGVSEKERIRYTGFIAQEVEDAALAVGYDFSGVDRPKNDQDHYGLRYDEFVVPLVKAVQEQETKIAEQDQKIAVLEQQLQALLARMDGQAVVTPAPSLLIYPNPVGTTLNVQVSLSAESELRFGIVDAHGRLLSEHTSGKLSAGKHQIALATTGLPAGAYFLQTVLDGKRVAEKFVVER